MAKRPKLATVVYVDGVPHGPGEVSAAVAKKITNPKVWASDDAPAEEPPEAPAEEPAAAPAEDSAADESADSGDDA